MDEKAEINNLPCCGPTETAKLKELPHLYGFDFDLHCCLSCGRTWVYALSTGFGSGRWEWVAESDAEEMLNSDGEELQQLMRTWGQRLD
ncbi:hypothetical protein ETAA8_69340 [Anatilimnocola aggregata]|uniref:Uncharacterized protein n=1 Tax=Anatilimnocola aggregata TaxID=2528021 RepID=A0A517YNH6_9BACT|nr:hypothetical protein [Anatilimnocola aggregata]QDU31774.1 hypothetical protein ETAA8_69340 [Anatilimnocola aggregata]